MGIVGKVKQVSLSSLELCRQAPELMELFFAAKWLPESAFWQRASYRQDKSAEKIKQEAYQTFERWRFSHEDRQRIKSQFLAEWENPELDLDKSWQEFTFLLAGYTPVYIDSEWTVPELRSQDSLQLKSLWNKVAQFFKPKPYKNQNFLSFLVKHNSDWDRLPLVNAFGAGEEMNYRTGYDAVRYLFPSQVEEICNGLVELGEVGLQSRFRRESERANPCPFID
ncbi:MAG: hypothetical protein NW224_25260 [Leptolyngbyaceae cyanobacterium bins.302]|nr:hypothetical protein [Leptolyngbyaceae cyanobacterium bins.302]